jgi:hypothetical protein
MVGAVNEGPGDPGERLRGKRRGYSSQTTHLAGQTMALWSNSVLSRMCEIVESLVA